MIKAGSDVHFRDPRVTNERVLYHAVVDAADEDDRWVATFSAGCPAIEAEQDVLIYFEIKREFMQQPARVHDLEEEDGSKRVTFEAVGDPVSAESRQHYRVSTITSDVSARIGGEDGCKVVDISSTGFAAVSAHAYDIGAKVDVVIEYGGQRCEGEASVQSVREKPGGRFRYGLLSIADADGPDFQERLNEISLEIQRSQLRRLSGAG